VAVLNFWSDGQLVMVGDSRSRADTEKLQVPELRLLSVAVYVTVNGEPNTTAELS